METKDFIDVCVRMAKDVMEVTGEWRQHLYHIYEIGGGELKIADILFFNQPDVSSFFDNEYTKKLLVRMSYAFATTMNQEHKKLVCAFLVSDAFFSMQEMNKEDYEKTLREINRDNYITPSLDPERKEGIMVLSCFRDREDLVYYEYTREAGRVTFNGVVRDGYGKTAGGIFSKLFPPHLK